MGRPLRNYQACILLILLHAGVCWSLSQDPQSRSSIRARAADYDLYVDYGDDYYEMDSQQPKEEPPIFVESGQHFVVGQGDSVVFNCATIKPSPYKMVIKKLTKEGNEGQLFYVGDVKIHRDRRIILEDGLLNMTMIRERDHGEYVCYYETNPVVQVVHTLEVQFAPKILFHSDDKTVSQREILTLKCIVEGIPEPRIVWYRSEGVLPSGNQEEEGPILMLDGRNKNIRGTYTCKAENGLGTASESVSITEIGLGTVSKPVLVNTNEVEDQNNTIGLETVSEPIFANTSEVQDQNNTKEIGLGTVSETLVTNSNEVQDQDNTNEVQYQNINIEKVITQIGWDSKLMLICTVNSGSSTSFRWEKNGIPLDQNSFDENPELTVTESEGYMSTLSSLLQTSEDFGNFSCIAENELDATESTIFIDDQPQKAKFTSDPEGREETRYLLTWRSQSNSPVIWYMVSIRNLANESSEFVNLGMSQNAAALSENNIYPIAHELVDLTPGNSYEVTILLNNKIKWSEPSTFTFSTADRETATEKSALPVMPIATTNLDWCEYPLKTVGSECFFFSDILVSEEDSQIEDTWENAKHFCEENGGNLAQPSSLDTLQIYLNEYFLSTDTYWIGGRRGSEDNIIWLSGETVNSNRIVNSRKSDYNCLQYRVNEGRLQVGSCEENYHWICEKADPFSQDSKTNMITEEEEITIQDVRQSIENQPEQTVDRQAEDRILKSQQPLHEHNNLTEEQQLQMLEEQLQHELQQQQQQQQQQQTIIQQQQQQQIPQEEIIQKVTHSQLDSQKQRKLQQKQNQSREQRPYDQDRSQNTNKINSLDNQEVSTTNKESVGENQEVSTTNKDSVGEYQPLRYMCPPNFLRLGNSCYYFGSEMTSWHEAHFACRDRDSQLIILETQWEDITIRHYLNKPEFARLNRWLGGIYNWSTRRWMWGPTGQVMPYLGFLTSVAPESSRWHCVFMAPSLNYRWNHELCTSHMHYICEAPQSKIPDSQNISYA